MKNTIRTLVALIVILTFTFIACNKDYNLSKENNFISSAPLTTTSINLVREVSTSFNYKDSGFYYESKYPSLVGTKSFTGKYLTLSPDELRDLCKSLLGIDFIPGSLVLYFNKDIRNMTSLSKSNVTAISYHAWDSYNYFHRLFIKDGEDYQIEKNYSVKSNVLKTAYITSIMYDALPQSLNNLSFICFKNNSWKQTENSFDGLKIKRAKIYTDFCNKISLSERTKMAKYKAAPTSGGDGYGNRPCGPEPGCKNSFPWQGCYNGYCHDAPTPEPTCLDFQTKTVLGSNDTTLFNDNLHYSFRDRFLTNSDLGIKYAFDFYVIGEFIYDNGGMSLSLANKIAGALIEMNNIASKILSPSGHEDEILISSDYHAKLTDIIEEAKSISTNIDYQNILQDLQSDLDWFEGKSLEVILNCF
jgi:hypothetical protein